MPITNNDKTKSLFYVMVRAEKRHFSQEWIFLFFSTILHFGLHLSRHVHNSCMLKSIIHHSLQTRMMNRNRECPSFESKAKSKVDWGCMVYNSSSTWGKKSELSSSKQLYSLKCVMFSSFVVNQCLSLPCLTSVNSRSALSIWPQGPYP